MAEIVFASEQTPHDEVRSYILDMIGQLAGMARDNGDIRLAALLERVLATVIGSGREH
ncbi:protein of unknown function [Beijerinckiaceae bacterium RH AL1]|jgi:hypothetical protein|nr:hypothetical protein [Beijerinckiaceae bacterium]VVB44109.1 protein of unknown function [Beijerinckiaceae bacterium RH CH11]VVB44136.1 protein of unknown function [Beijerinckiaceae bacterium RH AL8]VVC54174.1 protein of unknown function [Beijerinckiaceae bacterium RH AL1]